MIFHLKKEEENLLKRIFDFAKKRKIKLYIVGGYLRDIALKRERPNPDIDFCLKKQAIQFAKRLKSQLKAGFVVLDKAHGACRLVKEIKGKKYTLDFTDFRGKSLYEDLLHRDFTINTLAVELGTDSLIDPYAGLKDIKAKAIRAVNKRVFDEDPLRILRAFSFACQLGFKIDRHTLQLIKIKRSKLSKVSGERIRDELFKILDSPNAFEYLIKMDKLKILEIIFPEIKIMRDVKQGPYHHLDVWGHSLDTVRHLESLVAELKNNSEIYNYLDEVISSERRRRKLIKLGALLHDVGKPKARSYEDGKTTFYGHERIGLDIVENVARRIKLANDELDALKRMVYWHLRPGYLADNPEVTSRAKFRYFRDTGSEAVSVLLISISDQRATRGPLTTKESRVRHEKVVFSLIKEYFKRKKETKPARIINGDDLIKRFKLEPSPLIGKLLREIEELQAIGKIKTRPEAFLVANKLLTDIKIGK